MPVIKSAIKKLRQDKKRKKQNDAIRKTLQTTLKKAKKNPSQQALREVTKLVDKAAKLDIIHKNKAARIKSSLAKQLNKVSTRKTTPTKKTSVKKRPSAKSQASPKKKAKNQ